MLLECQKKIKKYPLIMPKDRRKDANFSFAAENPRPKICYNDIEKSITPFTGDDTYPIQTWIKEYEDSAVIMQWADVEMLIYAKRLLKGTSSRFLRLVGSVKSWNDFKNLLTEEFGPRLNSAIIHKQLASRRMKRDETYQQYFLPMKEMAKLKMKR